VSVVKINALHVPPERADELLRRFAARAGEVSSMPGFEAFELLRPTDERDLFLVYTRWSSEEAFRAWTESAAFTRGHRALWSFEVVQHEEAPA
jgi:heme-degrading monooxygenase HmoA